MRNARIAVAAASLLLLIAGVKAQQRAAPPGDDAKANADRMFTEGRQIFRDDTFGSEAFWGGTLQMHRAVLGEKQGGVGPGLSPQDALKLGLKVDQDRVPKAAADLITKTPASLADPATTVELLKANAVVGITGKFGSDGTLQSLGIQCSLCHSTVDDAFTAGIGHRRDGWPNRDLNVGAIVALAPNLKAYADRLGLDTPKLKAILESWGPGKYDAEVNHDGRRSVPTASRGRRFCLPHSDSPA